METASYRLLQNKKPSTSANWRMKASKIPAERQFNRLASSFSLTEKLPRRRVEADEHSQTGILTPGFYPRSRLPDPVKSDQWLWKLVARYSGATVPDSHGVP